MSIGAEIAANLPFLRRYARALAGSQVAGDAFVQATLEAALADDDLAQGLSGGRVPIYRAFTQIWCSANVEIGPGEGAPDANEAGAQARLARITPISRQALLLTTVEDFSASDAAMIIGTSEDEVIALVREAIEDIDRESTTSVLIIEDEPLISMQLEDLVRSLGHEICGTAATRTQAQEVVARATPGLVLADIQLADGSSGLDAVDDILSTSTMPVFFITAYPERLLTGDRPEPTYLITKPFKEDTVRAAISQALFFGTRQPLD